MTGLVKNAAKRKGAASVSKPKPDNPAQHKRFIETAREVEVDEREGGFDRAFEKVSGKVIAPTPSARRSRRNGKQASS
jgi:hypothetical protein